jgi:hypothetical protein
MDLAWAELVLHVLAHLDSTSELPSSLHSEEYSRAAAQHLGPVSKRAIAEDIGLLSSQLTTHEQLIPLQLVARLHPSLAAARRTQHLELTALVADGDSDLTIRDYLLTECPVPAELLRCAALLEAPHFANWPLPDLTTRQQKLERVLPVFWVVAPWLRYLQVCMLRVLGLRGRAWPDAIWIGIPDNGQRPSWGHVLWQACHEATVLEVADRAYRNQSELGERSVERLAVALLSRRAANARLRSGHTSWLSRVSLPAREWAEEISLSGKERNWLEQLT